jgi:hypothetical protein
VDPDPCAFLTPRYGIRNRFFPDPGFQTHIFESLLAIFGVKSSIILSKLAQLFFHQFKININFNFMILVATKKGQQICFHPSLLLLFLDPGLKIQDGQKSRSGIRDIPDLQHWLDLLQLFASKQIF